MELGEAWSGLRRAGWPGTRARVSGDGWWRGQSAREGEATRNEVRGVRTGHWRGYMKGAGRVGGRRGRETRRRARVRTRWSTAGARKAELTGLAHGTEGEKGTRGATTWRLAIRARENERERERGSAPAKETGADRSAPLGSEREREGTREGELTLTGGVRLSGAAGSRVGLGLVGWFGPAGLLSLFLFLWIL